MKYHSIVEQSKEGLTLICKKAEEFERDSILPAIQDKKGKLGKRLSNWSSQSLRPSPPLSASPVA